jgi:hypothetical protein
LDGLRVDDLQKLAFGDIDTLVKRGGSSWCRRNAQLVATLHQLNNCRHDRRTPRRASECLTRAVLGLGF